MCEENQTEPYTGVSMRSPSRGAEVRVLREYADKAELLWRTRIETTLNSFEGMHREMSDEEDAAKREAQKAYFAGASRAWELAAEHIRKLLDL
jgi:hypothetical protein